LLEELEVRSLLSASPLQTLLSRQLAALQSAILSRLPRPVAVAPKRSNPVARPIAIPVKPHFTPSASPVGISPTQMRHAYGIDQVMFGTIVGDGTGQTIAIIDAYHYPTAAADLHAFDVAFGLPDPPSLRVVAQDGTTNYPPTDPAGPTGTTGTSSWELEEALDVQWAHAIAPGANLILVEANDASFTNLVQAAVVWAKNQPGVTAISMSFGANEFNGENTLDSIFTTPTNHSGVTFLASTGDTGSPGGFPAFSPNVVAVGGTTLTLSGSNYVSETGWSGSGGGISQFESRPSYQSSLPYGGRSTPDVSMDADPASGVPVYDSYDFGSSTPWITLGGTSLACPMWAGIISIVNQGRAQAGLGSLDGPSETIPKLYALPAADFHDITSGSNGSGSDAGVGHDLVTGRGSPVANLLIPDLVGVGSISGIVYQDNNGNAVNDAGDTPMSGVTVYLDANNNGVRDLAGSHTFVSTNVPLSIPDNNSTGVTSTLHISGVGTALTDLNINFTINHTFDRDLTATLTSPDGVSLTLFARIGGSNDNFTNTTLDDSATTTIGAAGTSAPFNGTFKPSGGQLSVFNGHLLDGTWSLKIVDSASSDTGSLVSWSLIATTAAETAVLTDSQGRYTFTNLSFGSYTVRQIVPTGYIQTQPSPGVPPAPPPGYALTVNGTVLNQNFGNFPTVFTTAATGDGFSLGLDATGTKLQIFAGVVAPPFGATPTYTIALNQLPSLTFNFNGADETLLVDFSNGSPIPAGNIVLNTGATASNAGVSVFGSSSAQQVTLTDTQVGLAGGPALVWQTVARLDLTQITANYYGDGSNLPLTSINQDAVMYWQGTL
jgi:subtilisin-like proprotein convertase family protein